jgi:protein-tyrosine phosphatase
MNQIRPWLYIGKYYDTTNLQVLQSHQIGAMLQFAALVEHPGIVSLFIDQEDGQPTPYRHFHKGLNFIKSHKEAGKNILVACGAGISRSSTFTIAALRAIEQISLKEAYIEVKRLHPDTMPHPVVWKSMCRYFSDDTSFMPYLMR